MNTVTSLARYAEPLSLKIDVQDLAVITWCVPVERIRRKLPPGYEVDSVRLESREFGFVSAVCFRNTNLRSALLPYPRFSFEQLNFRTYVRHKGHNGVYFLASFLSSRTAALAQRTTIRNSFASRFLLKSDFGNQGYKRYFCSIESAESGTYFELRAQALPSPVRPKDPFNSETEASDFFTFRLHGFGETPAGFIADQMVRHSRMNPWSGQLLLGRFDYLEREGLLKSNEVSSPYSVLVEPHIPMLVLPAVPARWLSDRSQEANYRALRATGRPQKRKRHARTRTSHAA